MIVSGCRRTNRHEVLSPGAATCKHQTGYYTVTNLLQRGDETQSAFSANLPSRLMLSGVYATC